MQTNAHNLEIASRSKNGISLVNLAEVQIQQNTAASLKFSFTWNWQDKIELN